MSKCAKVRYRDRVSALIALSKLRVKDHHEHTEKRAYRCPDCKGWHLTSKGNPS